MTKGSPFTSVSWWYVSGRRERKQDLLESSSVTSILFWLMQGVVGGFEIDRSGEILLDMFRRTRVL
jgi:hypothetical protein